MSQCLCKGLYKLHTQIQIIYSLIDWPHVEALGTHLIFICTSSQCIEVTKFYDVYVEFHGMNKEISFQHTAGGITWNELPK